MPKLRFAMVCASNVNRSMEAHALLQEKGLNVNSFAVAVHFKVSELQLLHPPCVPAGGKLVESFGVGNHVKLPGPSASQPNIYPFGTPYQDIFNDLTAKSTEVYTQNGLLPMMQRNMDIKKAPERWHDDKSHFDVALTFEERVMEQLVEDMNQREQTSMKPLLVINMDVKDSRAEASIAAPQALRLCQMCEDADEWEEAIDDIIASFEADTGRCPVFTICFY